MNRLHDTHGGLCRGLLLASLACVAAACGTDSHPQLGTSSGNPNDGVPIGAELAKSEAPRDTSPRVGDADAEAFAADNRAFAADLYAQLYGADKNLFLSPYSISVALAMTYAGARGTTESEIAGALHFTLAQPELHAAFNALDLALASRKDARDAESGAEGFRLNTVNQAWGKHGHAFLDSYLDVLAANYAAGLLLVDFAESEATRKLINDWIADHTANRIDELLPENAINPRTRLVLTNAIDFKASWLHAFDIQATAPATFHAAGAEREVEMMRTKTNTRYSKQPTFETVELPYLPSELRMLLVLPAAGEFDAVAKDLASVLDTALAVTSTADVVLSLPRFSVKTKSQLKTPLQALGMKAAFGASQADFSGMDGSRDLVVEQIYHDAFVAVDESGTEATAATAVVFGRKSDDPNAVTVTFDRPFIFVIYDEPTGQILFLGQLVDPEN